MATKLHNLVFKLGMDAQEFHKGITLTNRELGSARREVAQSKTEVEKFDDKVEKLSRLLAGGALTMDQYGKRVSQLAGKLNQADLATSKYATSVKHLGNAQESASKSFASGFGGMGFTKQTAAFAAGSLAADAMRASMIGLKDAAFSLQSEMEEDAKIARRLALTLEHMGVGDQIEAFNEWGNTLKRVQGIDDEAAQSLATLAMQQGLTSEKAKEATTVAYGLAEAWGIDVDSALQAVIKASEGSFGQLEKRLPMLKEVESAEAKWAIVVKAATQGLELQRNELGTSRGEWMRFTEEVKDAGKEMVKFLNLEKLGRTARLGSFAARNVSGIAGVAAGTLASINPFATERERELASMGTDVLRQQNRAAFNNEGSVPIGSAVADDLKQQSMEQTEATKETADETKKLRQATEKQAKAKPQKQVILRWDEL